MMKIRVHKGYCESDYGTDSAIVFDDPIKPKYTEEQIVEQLMEKLTFKLEDGVNIPFPTDALYRSDTWYDGFFDEDTEASFCYHGYEDMEIPDSIIQRITDDVQ